MGNAGVCKESLKIVLPDRDEIPQRHRKNGEDRKNLIPFKSRERCPRSQGEASDRRIQKRYLEEPDHHGKPGSFRGDREERSDSDRSAFINIRSPEMKRYCRNLVTESRNRENSCNDQRKRIDISG